VIFTAVAEDDGALPLLISQDFNAFVAAGITTFDAAGELHCLHCLSSPLCSAQLLIAYGHHQTRNETRLCVTLAMLAAMEHSQSNLQIQTTHTAYCRSFAPIHEAIEVIHGGCQHSGIMRCQDAQSVQA
jgi:hypothetical protein